MRKLSLLFAIISAMSTLAGVAPVGAADLGPAYKGPLIAPAFNWNGFYAWREFGRRLGERYGCPVKPG